MIIFYALAIVLRSVKSKYHSILKIRILWYVFKHNYSLYLLGSSIDENIELFFFFNYKQFLCMGKRDRQKERDRCHLLVHFSYVRCGQNWAKAGANVPSCKVLLHGWQESYFLNCCYHFSGSVLAWSWNHELETEEAQVSALDRIIFTLSS